MAANIQIIGDIGTDVTAADVAKQLTEKAQDVNEINVHLYSLGGSVFEGLAIYNMLDNHPATINIFIMGIAASSGSLIAMAGTTVYIPENGWIMIHKPLTSDYGNADELRDSAEILDQFENSLIKAYQKKSGLPENDIRDLLKMETWMEGQTAIDKGFADELTEAVAIAATETIKDGRPIFYAERFQKNLNQKVEYFQEEKQVMNDSEKKPAVIEHGPDVLPVGDVEARANEPAPVDPTKIEAEFRKKEEKRRADINAVFACFDNERDLKMECLSDMDVTAEQAKDRLLNHLGHQAAPASGTPDLHSKAYSSNGAFISDGMTNAVAARAGLEQMEKGNRYNGLTLLELARASLTERGVSAYGMDRMQVIGAAFTHTAGDFGNVLFNTANKALLKGYEGAAESFPQFTTAGNLPDFKPGKRVGLGVFPMLDEVIDGAEYRYGTIADNGEPIQLATYGKQFSITRQCIINDDLGAFTSIPAKMGAAARRTVGNLVMSILIDNPQMSDGVPLFDAKHRNVSSEADLDVKSLDKAATVLGCQTDNSGAVLNIEPGFLIVPRALKSQATVLMTSMYDPSGKAPMAPNPLQNLAVVIADGRIDKAFPTKAPWFLLASRAFDTIEVAYLDGNEAPFLDHKEGWNVDGTVFKVRLDAGVSPLDSKTMVRNKPA